MTPKLLAVIKPMENKEHDFWLGSIRQTHHNGKKRNYGNSVEIKQCTVAKAFSVSRAQISLHAVTIVESSPI